MGRRSIVVCACFALLLALLPTGPATAHGNLPVGRYDYYYWDPTWGLTYGYEFIKIRPERRYTWNDAGTEYKGKYRHGDTKRIKFTTGFLSTADVTARHVTTDGQKIVLRWDMGGGAYVDQTYYKQN